MTETIKKLRVIHLALLSGQVMFGLVLLLQSLKPVVETVESQKILLQAMAVFYLVAVLGSRLLYRYMLKAAQDKTSPDQKIWHYQRALLFRWISLEISSFLALVCFMLSSEKTFLFFAMLTAILLALDNPSQKRFEQKLGL
jgi:hypothetical protein